MKNTKNTRKESFLEFRKFLNYNKIKSSLNIEELKNYTFFLLDSKNNELLIKAKDIVEIRVQETFLFIREKNKFNEKILKMSKSLKILPNDDFRIFKKVYDSIKLEQNKLISEIKIKKDKILNILEEEYKQKIREKISPLNDEIKKQQKIHLKKIGEEIINLQKNFYKNKKD